MGKRNNDSSENSKKDVLMEILLANTGGRFNNAEICTILGKIDVNLEYSIYTTSNVGEFASWMTLKNYESRQYEMGTKRVVDKGIHIFNGNLEFGRDYRYYYTDMGISISKEEKRIPNFNMRKIYIAAVQTNNFCDYKDDACESSDYRIYIYIPA